MKEFFKKNMFAINKYKGRMSRHHIAHFVTHNLLSRHYFYMEIDECNICLEDVPSLCVLVCGHRFCIKCLGAIYKKIEKLCPMCRRNLEGTGYDIDYEKMIQYIIELNIPACDFIRTNHSDNWVSKINANWRGILARYSLAMYTRKQKDYIAKHILPHFTLYKMIPFEVCMNHNTDNFRWIHPLDHHSEYKKEIVMTYCSLAREIEEKSKAEFLKWSSDSYYNQLAKPIFKGIDVATTSIYLTNEFKMNLIHYTIYQSEDWKTFAEEKFLMKEYLQLSRAFEKNIKDVRSITIEEKELEHKDRRPLHSEFMRIAIITLHRVIKYRSRISIKHAQIETFQESYRIWIRYHESFNKDTWTTIEKCLLKENKCISIVGDYYVHE